nr:LysE family translocator [Streptomyces sp. SID14478]
MDPGLLPAYLAAVLVITVAPGPDAAYIVAVALDRGPRAGVVSAAGMALGMVVHVTAAALGLAVLVQANPGVLTSIQAAGGLYLGWLSLTTLRAWRASADPSHDAPPDRRVFGRAVLTNLLNPKIVLFFAAFLPRFTSPGHGPLQIQLLTLGFIFLLLGLFWDSAIGLFAGRLGSSLVRGRRTATTLNVIAGVTFGVLALALLADALVRTLP